VAVIEAITGRKRWNTLDLNTQNTAFVLKVPIKMSKMAPFSPKIWLPFSPNYIIYLREFFTNFKLYDMKY